MRGQDRREITAVIEESDTVIGYMLFASSPGLAWCGWLDDQPVAAFGISRLYAGLGGGWAYMTPRGVRLVPAITRFALRQVKRQLLAEGFRRIEARTAVDHDISHRWLERLGFAKEGIAVDYGCDGLDFVTYAATKPKD
jgi:RimJ/RimL family protein N-acetyltransferase